MQLSKNPLLMSNRSKILRFKICTFMPTIMMKVAPIPPSTQYDRPFPKLGITMEGIQGFINHLGRDRLEGLTTTQVSPLVIELTKEKQCSYCDSMVGIERVGTANVFVSHAWKYQFLNVVSALQNHYHKKTEAEMKKIVFWFDLFSNSQHGLDSGTPPPFAWWCNTFMTAIKDIGTVVMVLEPWNNPITLTRVWCLWEVYCASYTGSTFEIAMCESETSVYREQIVSDTRGFLTMLSNIDVRNSDAFNPLDKQQIFEVINKKVGFPRLNALVLRTVRKWALTDLWAHCQLVLQQGTDDANMLLLADIYTALGEIALDADLVIEEKTKWLRDGYELYSRLLGLTHDKTLKCLRSLVKVDSTYHEKACELLKSRYGDRDVYYWDARLNQRYLEVADVDQFIACWETLSITADNAGVAAALVFRAILKYRNSNVVGLPETFARIVTALKEHLPSNSVMIVKLEIILLSETKKPTTETYQSISRCASRLKEALGPDHRHVLEAFSRGRDFAYDNSRNVFLLLFLREHWYSALMTSDYVDVVFDPYLLFCIPCNTIRGLIPCCRGRGGCSSLSKFPCLCVCCVPFCFVLCGMICCCTGGFKDRNLLK